jgi:predicted CXXCH cytochrome family protein
MKRAILVFVANLFCGFFILCAGQISGTAHDFSSESWAPAENKMCAVCHATHQATSITGAPLWSHESTAVAGYTLYSSATFDPHGGTTITDPGASSKLCLSCHDGTVALENFGGVTTGTNTIDPEYQIGGVAGDNLSNDHPISFEYTTALATLDGGLHDPATTSSGLGGTITNDMLFNNKLQCASCHDVHNKYGVNKLLKMDNTNSQLCLTCHDK